MIDKMLVRGAKVHNLKNIDVDIPLNKIVGIAGVSGSGKSSLALGVLYAEGSRRYLEALSTYTRRRMTQASKASVEEVLYVPAALALHQRPGVPGIRSTFGTGTELLNSLRLMYSRLASHRCPNGHYIPPTLAVAAGRELDVPKGRLTVVTGVSGSGKTTMVLESLVPALEAKINGSALPAHIREIRAEGIAHVKLIDATPIGINVRSTVATYAGVHDELRKLYAKSPDARQKGFKASDFSYNTGSLRCPGCDGTGEVSLDVQFLPDVNIVCPDCRGSRYARAAYGVKLMNKAEQAVSLPELMEMDVNSALAFCGGMKTVSQRLQTLQQLGLGYLTLGEETPSLSGGEAQRLKLASEIGRTQTDSVFVFDEPSIGLHPLDVQVLLRVFQALLDNGATVIVIEHDLDVIRNADYVIDMGPGGGESGGRVVATGTPEEIQENPESITGRYL